MHICVELDFNQPNVKPSEIYKDKVSLYVKRVLLILRYATIASGSQETHF